MTNHDFDLTELLTLRNADMLDDQIVRIDPIESQPSEDVPIYPTPIENDGPVWGGGPPGDVPIEPVPVENDGPVWGGGPPGDVPIEPVPVENDGPVWGGGPVDETTVPADSDPFYIDEHTVPADDPILVGESTGGPAPRPIGDEPVVDWGTDLNPTPPAEEGDDIRIEGGASPLQTVDGPEMVNQPIEIDETFGTEPESEPEMVNQPIELEADDFSDAV
jgi:hypothetical protein